ncbi:glycoside hydrolase family 18 protein [Actinomadura sediminis]|uniref:GH18 domain-containing protein n=1 Tax=Actinomadura sediminis TaxID=1038904 RepID=A0ABW3EJG4_9ACTN
MTGTVRKGRARRALRRAGWAAAFLLGLILLAPVAAWAWWQPEPKARGTATNALWARHQWVGEPHTDAEYREFADLLKVNRITDVYFHAGPFEADGTVPPEKYRYAGALTTAMEKYAPDVRTQAYLGQIRVVDGEGIIQIDDPGVRARILRTDEIFLDLGFDGIHYDLEPIYPDDRAFLDLLDATRELTRERDALLSVALEQPTLADAAQPVYDALLPRNGTLRHPARPTEDFLRDVAGKVDQVAIMTYDVSLPTRSLAGWHFARHTTATLELIGDRTTVFIGVPTYRPPVMPWAEDLEVALRGVRRGIDRLDRPPARPYGVGVYAAWTTSADEWALYRASWLPPETEKVGG